MKITQGQIPKQYMTESSFSPGEDESFAKPKGTPIQSRSARARKSLKKTPNSDDSRRISRGEEAPSGVEFASPPTEKKPKISGPEKTPQDSESQKPSYDELMARITNLENIILTKLGVSQEAASPDANASVIEASNDQSMDISEKESPSEALSRKNDASRSAEIASTPLRRPGNQNNLLDASVLHVKEEYVERLDESTCPPEATVAEQIDASIVGVAEDMKLPVPGASEKSGTQKLTSKDFYEHLTKLTYAVYLKSLHTSVFCTCNREFAPDPGAKKQGLNQRVRVHLVRCSQMSTKDGIYFCGECDIIVKDLQDHRSREHRGVQFKRSNWPIKPEMVADAIDALYRCFPKFEVLRNATKEEIDQLHKEALAAGSKDSNGESDPENAVENPENDTTGLEDSQNESQLIADVSTCQDGMKTFLETVANSSVNESIAEDESAVKVDKQVKVPAEDDPGIVSSPTARSYFTNLVVEVSGLVTKAARTTEVPCEICGKSLITAVAYIKDEMIQEAVKRHIFTHIECAILRCPVCVEFVDSPFSHRQRKHRGLEVDSCELWDIKAGSEIEIVRAIHGCFPKQYEQFEETQNAKDPEGAKNYDSVIKDLKTSVIKSEQFDPLELTCPFQDHLQAISGRVMRECRKRPVKCGYCDHIFNNNGEKPQYRAPIQTHMLRHLPEPVLQCPECPSKIRHMRPHMQRNHGKHETMEGFTIESEEDLKTVVETFHGCFPDIKISLKDYFVEPEKKVRRRSSTAALSADEE